MKSPFFTLSNKELYKKCQEYGLQARVWMRKFEGLLPEVYRRKLYKEYGFVSIHEFAGKLAGMKNEKVDKVLRLAEVLKNKPALKKLLETGQQGYSKIEKVAYVATKNTDRQWAEKVCNLPQSVLQLCVKEARDSQIPESVNSKCNSNAELGSNENIINEEKHETISFSLKPEVAFKLRKLKQILEKDRGVALSFSQVLEVLLANFGENNSKFDHASSADASGKSLKNQGSRNDNIVKQAKKKAKQSPGKISPLTCQDLNLASKVSRYIPANIRNTVIARTNGKCAFPRCNKPFDILHHTRRFALKRSHDPQFIQPLCKLHERLAHGGLIENEEKDPIFWKIRESSPWWDLKNEIDRKVQIYRLLNVAQPKVTAIDDP